MPTTEIGELIKWLLPIFIAIIMAWEKAKRWHYRRAGKDRRTPNPNLESKVTKLCQAFKDHEKTDKERYERIEGELQHFRAEQSRHTASIGTLKGRMDSR